LAFLGVRGQIVHRHVQLLMRIMRMRADKARDVMATQHASASRFNFARLYSSFRGVKSFPEQMHNY
jgi:hypothetical protein